ncbi:MAG: hypothetical protein F6K53_38485 [Moorea sp. SIO4A1]|uniref:hypothetical protein n=1 Tax=Moorena sp. SIO4A1 TaxID=2607835 RepID=UPI0014179B09|nr:hypothetical protein [Moorena sp. SIO4A1]NEO44576.1 hypothetical protein [Moorena sp. SIO4A3]NEQ62939.1 hypothetical protein [Moorena sp. SIO4A1]
MLTVANQAINVSSHPSAVSRQQLSAVSCQPSVVSRQLYRNLGQKATLREQQTNLPLGNAKGEQPSTNPPSTFNLQPSTLAFGHATRTTFQMRHP